MFSVNTGVAVRLADDENSNRVDENGISAFRLGISYLGLHGDYEQGLNVGYGVLSAGDKTDLTIGYDIRKVQIKNTKRPYRLGLYIESNLIEGGDSYESLKGTVFQLRPYMMTVTSEQNNWYAGVHGLLSFGDITGDMSDYTYNGYDYIHYHDTYKYSVTSLGGGISFGNELRLGGILLQSQVDLSLVNQKHQLIGDPPSSLYWDYYGWGPLKNTGPVIGFSTAIRLAPPRKKPEIYYPTVSNTLPGLDSENPMESPNPTRYDPFTGQIIEDQKKPSPLLFDPATGEPLKAGPQLKFDPLSGDAIATPETVKYDPMTGEIIQEKEAPKFDPETGLPVDSDPKLAQKPQSLLTKGEQSLLLSKGLKMNSLNGRKVDLRVVDINNQGLTVVHLNNFNLGPQLIPFEEIIRVDFEGGRKGMRRSFGTALAGCGSCVAIALGASIISGDIEALFMTFYAPAVGLGSWIFGAMQNESYVLAMTPNHDKAFRQASLLQVIRTYLQTNSFPKNGMIGATIGGKP